MTQRDHELNRAFRQVGTFWEMAYGMVKHGIVHAGYFLESNGEGFFLFAKIQPYLEDYRRDISRWPSGTRSGWPCSPPKGVRSSRSSRPGSRSWRRPGF